MNENEDLITKFYTAFEKRDGDSMAESYHADATFSDPVFTLNGAEAGAMWRMFCNRATDLAVTFRDVKSEGDSTTAHWEARYTFSATGRFVHNRIDARFRFQDGRIIEHVDRFPFWAWSRMALGTSGVLLGWTPLVRNKVQRMARRNLETFMQQEPPT
jgi:ketosteroid isomerase-like protein